MTITFDSFFDDLEEIMTANPMPIYISDEDRRRQRFADEAAKFSKEFDEACSRRAIRRASERAVWQNLTLPAIIAAGQKSRGGHESLL